MAIKSKNIKNSNRKKFIAIILASVMFLSSGFCASQFINGFFNFSDGIRIPEYTQTPTFRNLMNRYIRETIISSEYENINTIEELAQTSAGQAVNERYAEQTESINKAYDILDKSGIGIYYDAQNRYRYSLIYNGISYYFSYNGEPITYEEFAEFDYVYENYTQLDNVEVESSVVHYVPNDGNDYVMDENGVVIEELTRINPENTYNPNLSGNYSTYIDSVVTSLNNIYKVTEGLCYGEIHKTNVLELIEQMRSDELTNMLDERISRQYPSFNVKNINFALIYKDGRVVTNCGVGAKDTEEQIIKKLNSERFIEGSKNGKYTLYEGKPYVENKEFWATVRYSLFGDGNLESELERRDFLSGYIERIDSAYFALADNGYTDPFSVTENTYNVFSKVGFTSLYLLLAVFLITFFIACLACIYLLIIAGKTEDGIKINFFDKIPAGISYSLCLGVMFLLGMAVVGFNVVKLEPMEIFYGTLEGIDGLTVKFMNGITPYATFIEGVFVSAFFMIWTAITASFIRNIRNKTFLKHTLCCLLLRPVMWLWKKIKKQLDKLADKIRYMITCDYSQGQGTKFKIVASAACASFVILNFIILLVCGNQFDWGGWFFAIIMVFINLAAIGFCLLMISSLDRLFEAVNDIKNGNLSREIDTKYMPSFIERFANDILSMQDGLQNAVDSAVKDQRMKAELITNVSHDLKTPLTSIVTYVDLLKKCEINDEDALKYVSILDDKAQKMKKLIEDLVEASKASSGAVELHPVKINLCEFAAQAVGEHEDEFREKGIELVLKLPEYPVTVNADSQKTSRIIENLFSNIRKYALEGTRAYIEVTDGNASGLITFKNISRLALDISPEELTQRFVRGEASRTSEGNGLGLSIAKNLCELQKGKLNIQIDGDLFKATVLLPKE